MSFFSRRPNADAVPEQDNVLLYAGQITDQVILEAWARDRAESLARHRQEDKDLARQYPGYRKELNRQRAFAGLPPL